MPEAERRVLVSDDSPDVPNTTSDFYLQQLLAAQAQTPGEAGHRRRRRVHQRGLPRTRALGARDPPARPRRRDVRHVQPALAGRARAADPHPAAGQRAARAPTPIAGRRRSTRSSSRTSSASSPPIPPWKERLSAEGHRRPRPRRARAPGRRAGRRARHVHRQAIPPPATAWRCSASAARRPRRRPTAWRCGSASSCACAPSSIQIAGRVYLADHGTPGRTRHLRRRCSPARTSTSSPSRRVATAAAMEPPTSFPPLDDDRRVVEAVMPAWMGIQFKPLTDAQRTHEQRTAGAVTVMTVYPRLAGRQGRARGRRRHPRAAVGAVRGAAPGARVDDAARDRRAGAARGRAQRPRPCRSSLKPEPYPIKMPELPGPAEGRQRGAAARQGRAPSAAIDDARRRQAAPALLLGDVVRAVQVLGARGDGLRQGARRRGDRDHRRGSGPARPVLQGAHRAVPGDRRDRPVPHARSRRTASAARRRSCSSTRTAKCSRTRPATAPPSASASRAGGSAPRRRSEARRSAGLQTRTGRRAAPERATRPAAPPRDAMPTTACSALPGRSRAPSGSGDPRSRRKPRLRRALFVDLRCARVR